MSQPEAHKVNLPQMQLGEDVLAQTCQHLHFSTTYQEKVLIGGTQLTFSRTFPSREQAASSVQRAACHSRNTPPGPASLRCSRWHPPSTGPSLRTSLFIFLSFHDGPKGRLFFNRAFVPLLRLKLFFIRLDFYLSFFFNP